MKVWDRARIELTTPVSAVRHVTDCPVQPGGGGCGCGSGGGCGGGNDDHDDVVLTYFFSLFYHCQVL